MSRWPTAEMRQLTSELLPLTRCARCTRRSPIDDRRPAGDPSSLYVWTSGSRQGDDVGPSSRGHATEMCIPSRLAAVPASRWFTGFGGCREHGDPGQSATPTSRHGPGWGLEDGGIPSTATGSRRAQRIRQPARHWSDHRSGPLLRLLRPARTLRYVAAPCRSNR